ncbi:MAG: glycosyltransferase, partial [Perlucidibaca sp.]
KGACLRGVDMSLALIDGVGDLRITLGSQPDFGIYDALNRGVRAARGRYYLVIGSDDHLRPDAVAGYLAAITDSGDADVITADVMIDGRRFRARGGSSSASAVRGIDTLISSHSVGAIFRRDLHDRVGYYSRKLPICADQLFVYQAEKAGARFHRADFVAGEFTLDGTSARDALGMITETCRAKIMAGGSVWLQSLILILRLLKHQRLIRRQLAR